MNWFLGCVQLLVMLSIVVVPVYLFSKQRRWLRSKSVSDARTPRFVRRMEASVLGLLVLMFILDKAIGNFGISITNLPRGLIRDQAITCAIIAAVGGAWCFVCLKRSTIIATTGLITAVPARSGPGI